MTTTDAITAADRLTVVKLLADGRNPDFVAQATGHTRETVLAVGASHGYPDTSKLSWAVDVLTERATTGDRLPKAQHTRPADLETTSAPVRRPAPPARPSSTSAGRTPTPTAPAPTSAIAAADPLAELIAAGKQSTRARTRSLANRAEQTLATLRVEVDSEAARARAAAEKAAAEAKVRADIARLEAELAKKRALLPKHKAAVKGMVSAATTGLNPKTIRAWARDAGVDCPASGRVPRRVVDAYTAAHGGAA